LNMKKQVIFSLLATFTMIFIMAWQGSSLKTELTPKGILDLEFAGNEARLKEILSVWQLHKVYLNIYLDFLFIIAYSWFLYSCCKLIVCKRRSKTGIFIGMIIIMLSLFPGVFDIAENICMLIALSRDPHFIFYDYYLAFVKFVLDGLILLYIIVSLPVIFRKETDLSK